jgi:hypothetical protein
MESDYSRHSGMLKGIGNDPNWVWSEAVAELEETVAELRRSQRLAAHVTFKGLLGGWEELVTEVETGYELPVYEYANDVSSRDILDRVIARATPELGEMLTAWLAPLDARFEAATVKSTSPFHGRGESVARWYWRIPRKPVGYLKADLEALGITAA